MTTIVTLLHGTFARGAPWTKDGSTLRKHLAAHFTNEPIVFDEFEWSGKNAHEARVIAGQELASHIQEIGATYPDRRHFIVAHSHGGNVALLAHKHLPEDVHALGVATLGTPFIHAELSETLQGKSLQQLVDAAPRHANGISSFGGWFIVMIAAIAADDAFRGTSYHAWYWSAAVAAACGLLGGAMLYVIWPLVARMFHRLGGKRAALKLANALQIDPMPRTHIVSFRYPGDEAGLLLDALETTTAWPTRAIRWIRANGPMVVIGLFLLVMALAFIAATASAIIPVNSESIRDWVITGFIFSIIGGFALWQLLRRARYLLAVLRGHPGGFGWERPSVHAHVDIGVEPSAKVPAARSNVFHEVPFAPGGDGSGLRHSGLYEDPRILDAIADWMKATR